MEIKRVDFEHLDFTHFLVSKDEKTIIGMARERFGTKLKTFLVYSGLAKTKQGGTWFDLSFEDAKRLQDIFRRYIYYNRVHIYEGEEVTV